MDNSVARKVIFTGLQGFGIPHETDGHGDVLEILRERYARGEVTKEQYDRMRDDLEK